MRTGFQVMQQGLALLQCDVAVKLGLPKTRAKLSHGVLCHYRHTMRQQLSWHAWQTAAWLFAPSEHLAKACQSQAGVALYLAADWLLLQESSGAV
jgi:hypothetical protein